MADDPNRQNPEETDEIGRAQDEDLDDEAFDDEDEDEDDLDEDEDVDKTE